MAGRIMSIALIDYNMGNLGSVLKALEYCGAEVEVVDSSSALDRFQACLLPGVGSFGDGMENLCSRGFHTALPRFIASGGWFLGICLGMQMLLESSDESPGVRGLGIFPGVVRRFDDNLGKVPHIGWNAATFHPGSPLAGELPESVYFYFVHSYYVPVDHPAILAECFYLNRFAAALANGRCFATQFHPEKSQRAGLQLLKNFLKASGEFHGNPEVLA